jgi:hypothetical protein
MSRGFNLTAELNLRGPANIGTIVADIRRQLGTVTADVTVRVNPAATQNINALNQSLNQLNATLRNTAAFAGASTTSIQNFTRAVQAAVTASANLPNNITAAANATNNLTQNANQASRATNQITSEFQEFGRQAALAVRRFAALATVTSVIYGVSNAISSASKEFLDFNRELVRVSQVTDTSVKFLDGLVNRISSLSVGLGVSSKELIMVSSTLAQAGLTAKDTEKALNALALSALAPSFDSMNETVEGSIALMRQFGISAGDLEKALGSVNAVAAKFAVEASDIITAIQRTGGVFATSSKGVAEGTEALNQFIAVFTSVRATTRESAETIATGLRTIFTRIQRADTIDALKAYGVALTDLSGKFVGPYEAVRRLSEGLSQLDPRDLKFSRIVEELGGFRQIGKVIPLIQQLSVTQQAYAVAQRGQASLVNDAATAQQALAIRITKVREEFIAMVRSIGQSEGFQTFVNLSLNLASALIKITDSAKGALPALTAIAAIRGAGFVSQFATGFVGGLRRRNNGGPIQKFARGGYVPGTGDGDTVPAMLEPGEFVIRKRAVQTIGTNNLHRMNKYGSGGVARDSKNTLENYYRGDFDNTRFARKKELSKQERNQLARETKDLKSLRTAAPQQLYSSISRSAFDIMASQTGLNKNPNIPKGTKFFQQEEYYAKEAMKIVGKTFSLPGFVSTSKDFSKAKMFLDNADRSKDSWAAMMNILTKKGSKGIDVVQQLKDRNVTGGVKVDPNTGQTLFQRPPESENEFILRPGSKFRINKSNFAKLGSNKNLWIDVEQFAKGGLAEAPLIDDITSNAKGAILPNKIALEKILASGYGALDFDRTLKRTVGDTAYGKAKTSGQKNAVLDRYFRNPEARLSDAKNARLTQFGRMLQSAIQGGQINPANLSIISKSGRTPGLAEYINELFGIPIANMAFTSGQDKGPALDALRSKGPRASRVSRFMLGGEAKNLYRKYADAGSVAPLTTQEKIAAAKAQNIPSTAIGLLRDIGGGLSTVGAAVLEPNSRNTKGEINFNITEREIEAKVGQQLKNLPFRSKSMTGRLSGLSNNTYNSFNSALDNGIVEGINLAARQISSDLELSVGQIGDDTRQSFLSGINTGTRGNLFEDILTLMSGKFERAASRNFDFPDGMPSLKNGDFAGLPSKWIDAKASFDRASRAGEGSLKEKTLNEIKKDILGQKKKYFDQPDMSTAGLMATSPEGALTAQQLQALRRDKVTSQGNFYLDQANRVLRKAGLATVKASQLTKVGRNYDIPRYAVGGSVEDTVPALLTPGEFVINKKAAQTIGLSRLHRLNHADKVKGFNKGGPVGVQKFADGGEAFDDPALDNQARRMAIEIMKSVGTSAKEALTQARQQIRDSLQGPLPATGAPTQLTTPSGSRLTDAQKRASIIGPGDVVYGPPIDPNIRQQTIQQQRLERRAASRGAVVGGFEVDERGRVKGNRRISSEGADINARSGSAIAAIKSSSSSSVTLSSQQVNSILNRQQQQQQQKQSSSSGLMGLLNTNIFGGGGGGTGGRGLAGRLGSGLMSRMGNLGNAGMALAFMGPMIGEGASKLIGGKTGAGVGGAAANFSSAFAVGSQFGAIGAFVGALAGAVSAVDGFASGIIQYEDEISKKKIDTESNKASKNIEALGKNPRDVAATQSLVKNAQVIAAEEQKRMENAANLRKPGMVSNALQTAAEYASLGFYQRAAPDKEAIAAEEAAINKTSQEALMSAISAKVSGGIDFKSAVSQVGGGNSDFVKQQIAEADAVTKAKLNQIEETRKVETDPALIKNLDDRRRAIINASFMEQTAIIQATAAEQEKAKKAKALAVTMNQASVSIARTFSNMNQSLNVAALKISEASNSIDEIISGKSSLKTDFASQKAILENPSAFSEKERQGAVKQVSGFFGQDEKFVRGLSDFGSSAQDTITKIASAAQQSGSGNAAEDISRSLTDQLIQTFGDNRITEAMRQDINRNIKEQTEKGEGIDPQKLIDEADGLKSLINANKQALETTLKIYATVGEALNMYSDAVEKASELQNKVVERNAALANTLSGLNVKVKELFGRRVSVGERISGRMTEATIRAGVQPGQLNPVALSAQRDAFAQQQQIAKQNFENAKQGDIANPAVIGQITKAAAALAEWNRKLVSAEQSIENLPGVIQSNIEDILNAVGQKIAERESMVQAGAGFSEKLVTSTPEELRGLNATFNLLNNTLAGNITTFQNSAIAQKAYNDAIMSGSTTMEAMSAAQTAFANENKNAMSMFSEMIQISGLDKSNPDKARNMRADLLENFAKAQGMNVGNNPMFNQMIAALRAKPEDNPEIKALMDMYDAQKKALIDATQAANQLLVDKQAQVLTTAGNAVVEALKGVTVKFDEAQLRMMGLNIQRPGNVMGRADGGIVYASSGKFIPRGTDTVPAMLSPGEFVVNSRATKNNLPLLSAINRSGGGIIPEYLAAGSRSPQSRIPVSRSPLSNLPTSFGMSQEWWLNSAIDQYGFDHPITQKVAKRFGINNVRKWAASWTDDLDVISYRGRVLGDSAEGLLSGYGDNYDRMMGRGKFAAPGAKPSRGINLRRDLKALGSWAVNAARGVGSGASSFGSRLAGAGRAVVGAAKGPLGIGMGIQAASTGLRYLANQAGAPDWVQGAIGFGGEAGSLAVAGAGVGAIGAEMAIQTGYEIYSAVSDNQNYVKRKNEEIQSQMGAGIEPTGITRLGSNIVGNIFGTDASIYSPSTYIPGRGIPAAVGRITTAFAAGVGSSREAAEIQRNINRRNKVNEEYTSYELAWAKKMAIVRMEKEKAIAANDDAKVKKLEAQESDIQAERYSKTEKVGWLWDYKVDNDLFKPGGTANDTRLEARVEAEIAERKAENARQEQQQKDRQQEAANARQAAADDKAAAEAAKATKERELKEKQEQEKAAAAAAAQSARDRAEAVKKQKEERQKQYEFDQLQTQAENSRYAKLAKNGPVTPAIMDQHRRDMEQVRRLQTQAAKETDPGTRAQLNKEIREAKQTVITLNDKASRDPATEKLYTQKQLDAKWRVYEKGEIKKQKAEATQAAKQKASLYLAVAKATGNMIPNSPEGFMRWKSRVISKLEKKFFLSGRTSSDIDLLTKYGMAPETAKMLLRPMDSDLSDVVIDIMAQQSGKGGGYKYSDNELKSLRMKESDIVAQREKLFKGSARDRLDTQLKENDRKRLEVEKQKTLLKTLRGSRSFENVASRALNSNARFRGTASNNLIKKLTSQGIIDPRGDDVTNAAKLRLLGMENSASLLYPKVPGGNPNITPRTMNSGGVVYASRGTLVNYQPRGTDTVPAMLTPGEFVVNARSTKQHLPLLRAINRQEGGLAYLSDGDLAGQTIGSSSSSPGIFELTMFKKAITGTADLLDRLSKTLTTITNQPNGVSNTAGNGLNLDGLTAFTQKFGEFTVALGKINPIINMKGEHTVNVNINGMEAFKTMKQEFQDLVTIEIQKSMNALSANSEGAIPVQNIGREQE